MRLLNNIAWFVIIGLRPLFGPIQCRYSVTCTQYARAQLQKHTFCRAVWEIGKRFLSCNPFF